MVSSLRLAQHDIERIFEYKCSGVHPTILCLGYHEINIYLIVYLQCEHHSLIIALMTSSSCLNVWPNLTVYTFSCLSLSEPLYWIIALRCGRLFLTFNTFCNWASSSTTATLQEESTRTCSTAAGELVVYIPTPMPLHSEGKNIILLSIEEIVFEFCCNRLRKLDKT